MSSLLHPKFHKHNHHTLATNISGFPDASHDPIASYDRPFEGDFVCLNKICSNTNNIAFNFINNTACLVVTGADVGVSAFGDTTFNGNVDVDNLFLTDIDNFNTPTYIKTDNKTGKFWVISINNEYYGVRLWNTTNNISLTGTPPRITSITKTNIPSDQINVLITNTTGTTPQTYQWYKNNTIMLEETSYILNISDIGRYTCVVTNFYGTVSGSFNV
jgi:hypothetical protein